MDDRTKVLILFDIYGELLTEKQKTIMDYYYNDDLSLSEIGENAKISRQAIYDTVNKCKKILYKYEKKLHLLKRSKHIKEKKMEIEELLNNIRFDDDDNEIVQSIISKLNDIN